MAKIPEHIDAEYCPSWRWFEGVREFIQNAKDADEFENYKMHIEHFPRTNKLVISNDNVIVPPDRLAIMGRTSKRGTDQRGQFGEGFLLGALALVRAGHPVTVYNGDEVWRPTIEAADEGHPFAGTKLLHLHTRKLQNVRDAFSVEIENVSTEIWTETKKLFLFLSPPDADDIVKTSYGTVLLGPEYDGRVFARGIYVDTLGDLEGGYDVNDLKLDRDRRFIDQYDLKWKLPAIWNAAYELEPAKLLSRIYGLAKRGRMEVKELQYRADEKLLQALRAEFERENGAGTVPVVGMDESKELSSLGAKTAVVDRTLADLLSRTGLSADAERGKLESVVIEWFDWSSLTIGERDVCERVVELITKDYMIVTLNQPTLASSLLQEERKVSIARWALSGDARFLLGEVARQVARLRGCTAQDVLLDCLVGQIAPESVKTDMPVEADVEPLPAAAGGGQ